MIYKLLELRTWMIDDENCGVYEMLQEIPAVDEFDQHNQYNGMKKQEVKNKIAEMMRYAYGFDNNEDYPKCENYVLFADNKPVVIGGLMLEMTDYWKKHRGHLWYKTRPSERKKGYCSQFVKMLCERAKEFKIKELLAQCNKNNIGSDKVLSNNGFEIYNNPLCSGGGGKNTTFYKKLLF